MVALVDADRGPLGAGDDAEVEGDGDALLLGVVADFAERVAQGRGGDALRFAVDGDFDGGAVRGHCGPANLGAWNGSSSGGVRPLSIASASQYAVAGASRMPLR